MANHRRLFDVVLLAFRPARWSIFGFRFVPFVLFAAGVWAVVYGGVYHRITVTERHPETQHEEQETITQPDMPPMSPSGPPGMPSFSQTDPFGQPTDSSGPPPEMFKPPVKTIQVIKTTTVPAWDSMSEEREVTVNRAVTVAGIIRGPQGEVLRVMAAVGAGTAEGPGFCPS